MRGFSLVELSIVLVILGLLTGGILAGQNLIRAAELRAVSAEYGRYTTAINTFRDQYMATPGDMRNATAFWGRLNNTGDCLTNVTPAPAPTANGVCDGNGNGWVDFSSAALKPGEFAMAWRQMALAGLIEGSYSGLSGPEGPQHCTVGEGCPRSRMSNAGWGIWIAGDWVGNGQWFKYNYGNALTFGAPNNNPGVGNIPSGNVLKPEEAWNIDTKMDDGRATSGRIIAGNWQTCTVPKSGAATFANMDSDYNVKDNSVACCLAIAQAL